MLILLFLAHALALPLPQRYVPGQAFDGVDQYRDNNADVDVAVSPSKLKYTDLTNESVKEAKALFKVKAEYGEVFGFKKWVAKRDKLVESSSGRAWLIEGNYESLEGKTVHFLEVYWADQKNAKEYLFTSNTKTFQLEQFNEVFKP